MNGFHDDLVQGGDRRMAKAEGVTPTFLSELEEVFVSHGAKNGPIYKKVKGER